MSEWVHVNESLPTDTSMVVVMNEKGWMYHTIAIYHEEQDVFVLYDPERHTKHTLEVSHWIEIPHFERKEDL